MYLLAIGLVGLALAQVVIAIPYLYRFYSAVCTDGCALTPNDAAALATWGGAPDQYALVLILGLLPFALACAGVGGVIFWQSARAGAAPPFALFVAFTLILTSLSVLSIPFNELYNRWLARRDLWSITGIGMHMLNQVFLTVVLTLLPDGRLAPRWLVVPLTLLIVLGVGGAYVLPLLQPVFAPEPQHIQLSAGVWVIITLFIMGVQLIKYRREADPQRRRQIRWCGGGVALLVGGAALRILITLLLPRHPLLTLGTTMIETLLALALPISVGAAVLYERLWELPVVVSRAVVYALLSASVVSLYVLLVGGLGSLLQATGAPFLAALASGAVALLVLPLRDRLQRAVNRFLYGERDDPYTVLARLGRQLERAGDPQTLLQTMTDSVGRALKLPYVAIFLHEQAGSRIAAAYGGDTGTVVKLPLLYGDESLGELHVAPRGDDHELTRRDRELLGALVRQAGVAIQAAQLTHELRQSRERLVVAREEERRRLRRDLHDGIGPTLASLAQRIDTASYLAAEDSERTTALLQEVKGQVRMTIADLRRVVENLRPPVLDEFGLGAAVRNHLIPAQAHRGLTIQCIEGAPLTPLPAAIEVAAFRIVQEALSNVVRHAEAGRAAIRLLLERPDLLVVEVEDDGRGLPAERRAGVGLRSMRERAEELGGTLVIRPRASGGTVVRAELPFTQLPDDTYQRDEQHNG
ncbi:MAG: sensor histidine kinase [bacterium]|nr:sensor histidine kinase [bacterium]